MAPIPITVLGGYLGSGKTTLLNRLLGATDGRRVGVIVNDFGELGVDAGLLAASSSDGLVDLPNGCVCCTLGTALGESLELLASHRPRLDQIVIEASGVADPATLAAWGTTPGFADGGTLVLAAADDVRRLAVDRYVGGEVRRQLECADLVLMSKTDLVEQGEETDVKRWLETVSGAPTLAAASMPIEVAFSSVRRTDRVDTPDCVGHDVRHVRWSWRGGPVGAAHLDRFVAALPPSVIRAKGLVEVADGAWREVQVVGRRRSIVPWPVPAGTQSGVVAIGVEPMLAVETLDVLAEEHLGGSPAKQVSCAT